MALPTTITGASFHSSHRHSYIGPFISSSNNVYVITQNRAYKATDPTSSFSEVDSANRPGGIGNLSNSSQGITQVGDKLHIVFQSGSPSLTMIYWRFDMSTDAWDILDGATARHITVASGVTTTSDAIGDTSACDIAVLSGGSIRIVAQTGQFKDMGSSFAQVGHYVSSDSGATWSAATTVNGSTVDDYTGPRIALPPSNSDQCHILYRRATNAELYQRAISSGGTLRTERATGVTDLDVYGVSNILGFDRT